MFGDVIYTTGYTVETTLSQVSIIAWEERVASAKRVSRAVSYLSRRGGQTKNRACGLRRFYAVTTRAIRFLTRAVTSPDAITQNPARSNH